MNDKVKNLIKILKDKITEDFKGYNTTAESREAYLKCCECVLRGGKLYFPDFHNKYDRPDKEGELKSYRPLSNLSIAEYLKEIELPYPVATAGDYILCRCLSSNFSFYYGNYELNVVCNNCGNEWSAYSG